MSKTLVIGKYFRLIDFHVYDNHPKKSVSENSSESSRSKEEAYLPCSEYKFTIQMFGLNEKGETCCIYINDYKPFFYIKVGDSWTNDDAQNFLAYLKSQPSLKYVKTAFESITLVEHNKL